MTIDVQVTANTNPAIQALDRLGTKIESIQGKFSDSFSKMNIAATALGGTLIALGATVARFADEITDIADANGLATAEVLAFQTALQASGGKADNVGQALQRLSNAVDDANNGNMKAVGSFAKLGVSMTDLGNLSQSEIREKLLTSLSNIPDAMQRNALATEFFGKALIGVDLTKLIAQEQAARVEAEKYAPALETAGAAFDKILSITNQIKMAFAQAFEPLFRIIKDLNIQTDTLVTSFRLLGAALVTITAASTANAILKLSTAFGVLNSVVAKNPLIRLGIALASAAAGVAAYVGLTGDAAEATKDLNKEIEKPKTVADQSGYLDVLAKQRTAISKSTGELERGFKIAQDKYNIDLAGLSLTEDQKNAEAAKAKIQQDADKAKADAQAAFDALDKTSQATQRTFLAETLKGIDDRAVKEKAASDERLTNFARERDLLKQLQSIVSLDAGQRKSMFDAQMKFENSRIMGINEEIAAEEQLKSIGNLRAELLSRTTNLKNGVMDYGSSLKQAFSQFKLSPEAEKILTAEPFKQIIDNGKTAIAINQFLSDQSRTFAYGWEQAFKTYVREADNAATQAQQLFGTLTKGIEDAFVTLAQTGKTSFKGLLSDITAQLLRSQIRQLLSNLFTPNQNGGGLLGSIFTAGKKLLGFANGGIIPTNGPVIVGERGPELLSGAAGRTVTPNNQLGSTSVTYNINAVDAMSFKQMLAQDPTFLHAVAEQGRRTLPGAR